MVDYVLKLGENITLSVVKDNQLVYHLMIPNLSDMPDFINGIKIDSIILLVQGTTSIELKSNSTRLCSFTKNNSVTHFIMPDRDLSFLAELCNTNGIKNLYLHSYLDYISDKFKKDSKLILVDSYLDKYIVMYLEYGELKDLLRTTDLKLTDTICYMKNQYDSPIVYCKDYTDTMGLISYFRNFNRINKEYLFSTDHLPYCLKTKTKSLIGTSTDSSLRKIWSDFDYNDNDEENGNFDDFLTLEDNALTKQLRVDKGLEKPRRPSKDRVRSRVKPERVYEEIKVKKADIVVNLVVGFLILLSVSSVYLNAICGTKVELLKTDVELSQVKYENLKDVKDGSVTSVNEIEQIIKNLEGVKVSSYSYDNGEFSIVTLSETDEQKESVKSKIEKSYIISGSSYMGNYDLDGKSYEKTKFLIVDP